MKLFLSLILLLILPACSGNYNWGWYAVSPFNNIGSSNLNFLLSGLGYTISISLISIFFATLLGLAISMIGLSKSRIVKTLNISYIEIIRSVPVLVMILWIYYGLPVLVLSLIHI